MDGSQSKLAPHWSYEDPINYGIPIFRNATVSIKRSKNC